MSLSSYPVSEGTVAHFEWKIANFFEHSTAESPSFAFNGSKCTLMFCSRMISKIQRTIFIILLNDWNYADRDLTCNLGVKKLNGTVVNLHSQKFTFPEFRHSTTLSAAIRTSIFRNRRKEFVFLDDMTIVCSINTDIPMKKVAMTEEIKGLHTLASNFEDLLLSKKKCDATIKVGNTEFKVHRLILGARSPVFAAMFEYKMSEVETGTVTITDCDPQTFWDFLRYLYTGKIEENAFKNVHRLYVVADKYDVQELKTICCCYMVNNLALRNLCEVVALAEQYGETVLMSSAQTFFNKNFGDIFATDEWRNLLLTSPLLANSLLEKMATVIKSKER